ncbi:hypothetical protein GX441_08330 [bacterium]|nr:hypothetical protein [bacterium]
MKKITFVAFLLPLVFAACNQGPDAPVLISPDNGSVLYKGIPFSWNQSPGATSYRFEIGTDGVFSTIVVSRELAGTSCELDDSEYSLFQTEYPYYWHVYAIADGVEGPESSVRWFTLGGGKP